MSGGKIMQTMNNPALCMGCMRFGLGPNGICVSCGANDRNLWLAPHHIKPHTVIGGNKYVIGRVLGEGGFGITYMGWDIRANIKVAIKEYYPNGFATRSRTGNGNMVQTYGGEKGEFYRKGLQRFIEEARRLLQFFGLPSIVLVRDFFPDNATAYIVMEFVEGATMKTVLKSMGGRLPESHVLGVMRPLISSLAEIHRRGVLHRDISPDNIMLQPHGEVKLIDFGSAREQSRDIKSSMAVMKHGYAPEEQYDRNRSRQGPWTDIYSVCATIYRAIEGSPMPDAIARLQNDTFRGFSVPVNPNTRRVLMKGLAVKPENRWQSITEFEQALYPAYPTPLPPPPEKDYSAVIIAIAVVGGIIGFILLMVLLANLF